MSIDFIWIIIQAAVALGLLIFVHELGHFLVAKWCGVKVERFMIGFDIGGLRLSRKWGETEYGIGIVPLGGYVKMLGQDDNPAHIAEQLEKSHAEGNGFEGVEVVGPGGEKHIVDRRSYIAKSVPQRMAIISAGVIMNVIFAVVFATIAFGLGVPETPSIISKTVPGSAAWHAGLKTGDEIVQIADVEKPSFSQLMGRVTLADLEAGVPMVVRRGEQGTQEQLTLKPQKRNGQGLAKIGINGPASLKLIDERPTISGTAAHGLDEGFEGGEQIVAVNGQPVESHRELVAILTRNVEKPLEFTVRAPQTSSLAGDADSEPSTRNVTVPPNPLRRFGLVMQMGEIIGVQEGSPAAAAGLQPEGRITRVEIGDTAFSPSNSDRQLDPLTLPAQLQQLAQDETEVTLTTTHGTDAERTTTVSPRSVDWLEATDTPGNPLSIPELGLAYEVLNEVVDVVPGSPAAEAGLRAGDRLLSARLMIPKPDSEEFTEDEIELGDQLNWPMIVGVVQDQPMGTKVEITYQRDGQSHKATLAPIADPSNPIYLAERGLRLEPLKRIQRAETFAEQLRLGWNETVDSLLLVYRFLQKLWEGQVPATALGGPGLIAQVAYHSASAGLATLLIFMTMLSANLAVVNFLPIPVLDGGHMVFLAYEGIFRRPPNERIVVALHMAGFALIVGLMTFLILLDVGLIQRNL